ncbi:MAG: winged helix-turn-helix domain-containing protein [Pseudomonadota bacterium]
MRYRFENVEIDGDALTVQRNGKAHVLQPRPFSLLEYLIIHRDRVVPKGEILSRVWQDRPVSDAALTTAVRDVRRALGETATTQGSMLRSYYSRGLRFVAPDEGQPLPVPVEHSAEPTIDSYPRRIAVLPFDALSEHAEVRSFAAGLTEDAQIMLSKFRDVWVLSRSSSSSLVGLSLTTKEIGARLGARYVVEGSVRPIGSSLRIYVSVFEAHVELPVWGERFDLPTDAVDERTDAIVSEMVSATVARIHEHEVKRAREKPAEQLDPWESFQLGKSFFYLIEQDAQATASKLFEQTIDLDPTFAEAYAFLSYSIIKRQWSIEKSRGNTAPKHRATPMRVRALEMASKALELDPKLPFAWVAHARSSIALGRAEEALRSVTKALELNPNMGFAHYLYGFTLLLLNRPDDALKALNRALETSPQDSYRWIILSVCAIANIVAGQYQKAIQTSREAQLDPHATFVCDVGEVVGLALLERTDEAIEAGRLAKEKTPDFCVARFDNDFAFMDPKAQQIFHDGFSAARVT